MAPSTTAVDAAPLLAVIADPVRWRILSGMSATPRCVCVIQDEVDVSPSLLSYHLKILRRAGLVQAVRRGRWIDYTLVPDAHDRLAAALPTAGR
jgi:ArsR family transcriptional regulator